MDGKKIIEQWYNGICIFHISHHVAASYYARMHLLFGLSVVTLTSVVGTTIFLSDSYTKKVGVIVGLLSVLATILSSLQTFLNYSDLSSQHKNAAAKFGSLRRELDVMKITVHDNSVFKESSDNFRKSWDCAIHDTPAIPQRIHDKVAKNFPSKCQGKTDKLQ